MLGVAFIHESGCVHKDLKPDNMLVMKEFHQGVVPRVVVTDWGTSQFKDAPSDVMSGDPRYMAPENLRLLLTESDTTNDISGDIWSMGATLFELLSRGKLPFFNKPVALADMRGKWNDHLDKIGGEDVDVSFAKSFSPQVFEVLTGALKKTPHFRLTALEALSFMRKPKCNRSVRFTIHPQQACQIVLNAVMWRFEIDGLSDCLEVFRHFDADHKGILSRDNFKRVLQDCGAQLQGKDVSDEEMDHLFDRADINEDDLLEFNEFAAICFDWSSMPNDLLDKHLSELIVDLSGTGSNALTKEDLGKFFGAAVPASDLESLFRRMQELPDAHSQSPSGCVSAPQVRHFLKGAEQKSFVLRFEIKLAISQIEQPTC